MFRLGSLCRLHGHLDTDRIYQPEVYGSAGQEQGVHEPRLVPPAPVPGRFSGPVQPQEQASPPPILFSPPPKSQPLSPSPQSLSPAENSTLEQPPQEDHDKSIPQDSVPRTFRPVPPLSFNGSQPPVSPDVSTTLRRVPPQSAVSANSKKSQNGGHTSFLPAYNVSGFPRFGVGQLSPRSSTDGVVNSWQPLRFYRGLVSGRRQGRSGGVAPINYSVVSESPFAE